MSSAGQLFGTEPPVEARVFGGFWWYHKSKGALYRVA